MRRPAALLLAVTGALLFAAACANDAPEGAVHIIEADGTIGPIMDRYLDRAITRAEESDARLAVIELDTPGGLSSSMREIVQRIERANVPIAVYVSPSGGRAASAGTFITMAAHIAAMAPNTSIGAAAAINADGSDLDGTLGKKVENDAVAFIRGIAELRGRNADWAESAVREATAATQSEAVELNVVDFVSLDLDHLLRQAEGRTVELRPGVSATVTGATTARRVHTKMTAWEHFLEVIADPTVASLLISIGVLGIFIELGHPGLVLPGTVGVICIALGFLGMDVLPVDTVGLVLLFLGLLMIFAEVFVPSGILGASGVVAIILGAVIAFRDTPSDLRPPTWAQVAAALALLSGIVLVGFLGAWLRRTVREGVPTLVGRQAVARTDLVPEGWVFIDGERWRATADGSAAIEAGTPVRITAADGLHLRVVKEEPE